MTDPERFRHDRSAYERPTFPYRCGRAALWGKPCARGPNIDGTCGGTTECTPFFKDGRYECRRPRTAGGPCAEGPLPDGTCSQQQPPCVPRPTLRAYRGRLTLLSVALIVALIAAFLGLPPDGAGTLTSVNPGPLSGAHANFTKDRGCVACHEAHDQGVRGWLKAAFSADDLDQQCVTCHVFGGPANLAHNAIFPGRADLAETTCTTCHTEHKGEDADISMMSDAQCNSCHKLKAPRFASGHPDFGPRFPYQERTAIHFDHTRHLNIHFEDPRYADRAPQGCVSCHEVETAEREVRPAGFEKTCAACHAEAIPRKELVVLNLPEFTENLIDREDVLEACGPTLEALESLRDRIAAMEAGEAVEEEELEDYESVSGDSPMAIGAYLLGIGGDDPEAYQQPMQELVLQMAASGADPLAQVIADRSDPAAPNALLAGLSPETAKQAACAWAANLEYEAPAEAEFGGWYGDGTEIRYKPGGHADPVVNAWLEFAIAAAAGTADEEDRSRAEAMRNQLLSVSDGPGGCIKCHAVSATSPTDGQNTAIDVMLNIEWTRPGATDRFYTRFAHKPHINLLGPGAGCRACHKLDETVDFGKSFKTWDASAFVSNFKAIGIATCTTCHAKGQVREDCQLCHLYHLEPAFKKGML
ncbi:MAG: cytochrome c3 family protein [Alphaproteobacteria bacterium]